jgi:hypothetical protein
MFVDDEVFSKLASRDFRITPNGLVCATAISRSWGIATSLASTPDGLAQLNAIFKPCTPMSQTDVSSVLSCCVYVCLSLSLSISVCLSVDPSLVNPFFSFSCVR